MLVIDHSPLLRVSVAPHEQFVEDTGTHIELDPLGCHINTVEKLSLLVMLSSDEAADSERLGESLKVDPEVYG